MEIKSRYADEKKMLNHLLGLLSAYYFSLKFCSGNRHKNMKHYWGLKILKIFNATTCGIMMRSGKENLSIHMFPLQRDFLGHPITKPTLTRNPIFKLKLTYLFTEWDLGVVLQGAQCLILGRGYDEINS